MPNDNLSVGFSPSHHGMKSEDAIRHAIGGARGEAPGSTLGSNQRMPKGSQSNPYGGDEVEVVGQGGKSGFTGGKTKNALTGQEFSDQASAQANEADYRAGKKMVRTQVGPGSATMEAANPSFAAKIKANPIKKDKNNFPTTSNMRGEVATDYGGGDVATYYNGEKNPVETAALDALPASDKNKLNMPSGTLAPDKETR